MKFLLLIDTNKHLKFVIKCHFLKYQKEQETVVEWRLNDENKEKLDQSDIDFAFEQAEKQLEGTVKEADILVSRTSILMSVILGLVASFTGYSISQFEAEKTNVVLLTTSILSIIYLAFPTFNLIQNFRGHRYGTIGSEPILLLDEYYLIKHPDKSIRIVKMKFKEISEYQKRIEINKKTNILRWAKFNYSLNGMVYFPFYLVISFIVIKIIFNLF
jgi:hypothetical protein